MEVEGSNGAAAVDESERQGAEIIVYDSDDVRVVFDSLADNTEVPDSLDAVDVAMGTREEALDMEVAHAIINLQETNVNTFESDKVCHYGSKLMLPVMLPSLYGDHDKGVNDAAVELLWMSHGYVHRFGSAEDPDEGSETNEFKDVKLSMLKIVYPLEYGSKK